mmetsp:Transcript_17901/g.18669  ORF Transcript_17901/g.18669 Transcript_17901/m.18669 type:complete len:203 (-) Transcript_17901:100-708(-)
MNFLIFKNRKISFNFLRFYSNNKFLSFGITDKITDMFRGKILDNKEKSFKSIIDLMLETPQWKLKTWKVVLEQQANQWQMKIPGMSNQGDAKNLKLLIRILDSMSEDQLEHPEKIKSPQREKIAIRAETTPEEVAKLINQFNQTLITYEWLKFKKGNGEALPTTDVELAAMQSNDSRYKSIATKILFPNGFKPHQGRKRSVF